MTVTDFFATIEALGFAPADEAGITVTETPEPTYRIKGTTGDVTDCAFGHTNLKKTVALAVLDVDGNEGEIIHLGTDCAAKAMRTTETKVRNTASAADHERAEKVAWATEFVAVYGPVDGDRRATAQLFFSRNPHARGEVTASEWVGKHLAQARALLAA